jgi:hypothetical protein
MPIKPPVLHTTIPTVPMGPIDALWHLLNFFGPAIGVGLIAAGLCKLVWWRSLKTVAFGGLALWAMTAGAVALVAGLVAFGRDGRMATYGLLVVACATALWWRGLRRAG